jgi:hypothetical protein
MTMQVVTRDIGLDINSNPAAGARNVTAEGAQFDIFLDQAVSIPDDAFNATVRVDEATVWNSVFNISAALGNNKFRWLDGGVPGDLTIGDGNYSVDSLYQEIYREYWELTGAHLVLLEEDSATERVVMFVIGSGSFHTPPGVQIDFTAGDTPRVLLGFNAALYPTAGPTLGSTKVDAPNVANFAPVQYFKIHSDIGEGIRSNNGFDQTIARINIDAPPGSQVTMNVFNPARSEANALIGADRNRFRFWLTDELNRLVDTHEVWSVRVTIEYQEVIVLETPDRDSVRHRAYEDEEGTPIRKRRRMGADALDTQGEVGARIGPIPPREPVFA